MLTPQQIQQVKTANGVSTAPNGGIAPVAPSAPLDDSSFESWVGTTPAKKEDKPAEKGVVQKRAEEVAGNLKDTFKGAFDQTKVDLNKNLNDMVEGSKNPDGSINPVKAAIAIPAQAGKSVLEIGANTARAGFGAVSDIIGGFIPQKVKDVYSSEWNVFKNDLKKAWDEPGATPEEEKGRQEVHQFFDSISKAAKDNPEVAKSVGDAITLVLAADGAEGGINAIKSGVAKTIEKGGAVIDASKPAIDVAKEKVENLTAAIKEHLETGKDLAVKGKDKVVDLKDKVLGKPTVEEAVGKVAQGSKEDVPSFARGLKNIDMKNIKTYDDLAGASEKTISKLAEKQNANLASEKGLKRIDDFKVNVDGVEANYVKDALDQLKALYEKTNNAQGLAKVKSYLEKANSEAAIDFATNESVGGGLTVSDVNEIAKLHGRDLNAYNANNELATGLSKQGAENTRKGLKTTVKENLTDSNVREDFEMYDKQMSDTFTVKDLSKKYSEAVNKLNQKLEKPNILQKLTTQIGKAMKYTGVKSFLKEIGLGKEGATTLNPVEIEAKLPKLLKIIDEGMKDGDDAFVREILKLGGDK